MDQQPEQIDGVTSAEPKAEWTRPGYFRLDAGRAELGDISNPDGPGTNS